MTLRLTPVSFRQCCAFVQQHHRHNKPPRGWKFGVGVINDTGELVGVGMAGRPVARALDDGSTLEVNRTCVAGTVKNANSMLYGALWRAAKALGYQRLITYTQGSESGSSLKAVGWTRAKDLAARGSWADSSKKLKHIRDAEGTGGVERTRWEISLQRRGA